MRFPLIPLLSSLTSVFLLSPALAQPQVPPAERRSDVNDKALITTKPAPAEKKLRDAVAARGVKKYTIEQFMDTTRVGERWAEQKNRREGAEQRDQGESHDAATLRMRMHDAQPRS
jgi:hypothetical protein